MKELNKKNNAENLARIENQKKYNILFDQTDKPFLLVYLIIFILGIILTISAIK